VSPGHEPQVAYGIDDRPPAGRAALLGLQHLVAMLLGNITPPLLIAGGLGLATGQTAFLIQTALFMAGLATIVQSYPIGPVGGRIPVVMGTSIAFVGAIVALGQELSLAAIFGACLVAALAEVVLGAAIGSLKKLFPPLVNGTVVMLIGLTLIPVGMDYAAGGVGADDYGSLSNLGLAILVGLVTLGLNRFSRGFLRHGSLLVGAAVGYLAAVVLGKVDFARVTEVAWLEVPRPLAMGLEFHLMPIVVLAFIYVVSAMETLGDISGTMAAVGRQPTTRELRGGLLADGVMSALAAVFSAFPNTSYSQNVGLVNFTGVVSRHVTAVAGMLLVALGIVPKVAAIFASIPPSVIGGGGLIMFSMIFASGLAIVHRNVPMNRRTMVILAVAIGLGLGVELRPDVLQRFPEGVRTFFGTGLVTGGLAALVLNLVFPDRMSSDD
jgi:NCS2 family nucleobase:cation symporter-2